MIPSRPTNAKARERLFLKRIYEKVGETGRSMSPLEYTSLAKEIGFSDDQRTAALRQLKSELLITYPLATTEAICLTSKGAQDAEYLRYRNEFILASDPRPDSLEGVREEIDYWVRERHRSDPRGSEWQQINARLDDLKHQDMVMIKEGTSQTVYIVSGAGSRLNVGSVDNSVTISEANIFPKLRSEIEAQVPDSPEKLEVLTGLKELENAQGSPSYGAKFKDFISVSANLMTIIAPFIQPLSSLIK